MSTSRPTSLPARLLIGASPREVSADAALLVLRVVTGLSLAFAHGLGKLPPQEGFIGMVGRMGFPAPEFFAWAAALAEFGGGLMLALGFLTRPMAALIAFNMGVVVLLAKAGTPFGEWELGLFYGVIALVFMVLGAGRYSLDAALRRRAHTVATPHL